MIKGILLNLMILIAASGCALPQKYEVYHFEGRDPASAVEAQRYAGRKDNPFHHISIDLKSAPAFQLHLPDGHWVDAREITRETLVRHGVINQGNQQDVYVSWHPPVPFIAYLAGRHRYVSFLLDEQGQPYRLHLGTCGYSFGRLLRPADGGREYGLPLTIQQATELFGEPSSIETLSIITGFSCL